MKALGIVALGMSMALSASRAGAQTPPVASPWELSVRLDARWNLDPSIGALSGTRVPPAAGLALSRAVTRAGSRVEVGVGVAWWLESTGATLRQSYNATLVSNGFSAEVYAGLPVGRWFMPYVRLAGGAALAQPRLDALDGSGALSGSGWYAFGTAGLGAQVRTSPLFPDGPIPGFRVAFSVEGGVLVAQPVDLTVSPERPSSDAAAADRVAVQPLALGTWSSTGPYLRFQASVRF